MSASGNKDAEKGRGKKALQWRRRRRRFHDCLKEGNLFQLSLPPPAPCSTTLLRSVTHNVRKHCRRVAPDAINCARNAILTDSDEPRARAASRRSLDFCVRVV